MMEQGWEDIVQSDEDNDVLLELEDDEERLDSLLGDQ